MFKIISVIGARPQFIKAAPMEIAMKKLGGIQHFSIHTGQHYDANMSQIFFSELGLQEPYINLQAGSGSHAVQTAAIMTGLEPVMKEIEPDLLVVYGDTNSTIAAALVAAKLEIPVVHVEAGLRSFNRSMPEEVNRVLTDHISDLLFAPTTVAIENLKNEGLKNIYPSGDVMLDMLLIAKEKLKPSIENQEPYFYATLHRPYNTDSKERLNLILDALNNLTRKVWFTMHPRTRNLFDHEYGFLESDFPNIRIMEPQGYFENLQNLLQADCLITDSGGMQKEAYFLKKRCITIRSETEWTETLKNGCNTLIWEHPEEIAEVINRPFGPFMEGIYGEGNAAEEMVSKMLEFLKKGGRN